MDRLPRRIVTDSTLAGSGCVSALGLQPRRQSQSAAKDRKDRDILFPIRCLFTGNHSSQGEDTDFHPFEAPNPTVFSLGPERSQPVGAEHCVNLSAILELVYSLCPDRPMEPFNDPEQANVVAFG